MKVIVQIPVYNEEESLKQVLDEISENKKVTGVDTFMVLVINDGSRDKTLEVAQEWGVDLILDLKSHSGLGAAFRAGLKRSLQEDADIIVNIDGDFQYRAAEIPLLLKPLLNQEADMVVGDRQISKQKKYPYFKAFFQRIGNSLISCLLKQKVKDSTSGFRAMNAATAALLVNELGNNYTYTVESLCLLAYRKKQIRYVPVTIRTVTRPSRLITSKIRYVINYLRMLLAWRRKRFIF